MGALELGRLFEEAGGEELGPPDQVFRDHEVVAVPPGGKHSPVLASRPNDTHQGRWDMPTGQENGQLGPSEAEDDHSVRNREDVLHRLLHMEVADEESRKGEVIEANLVGTRGQLQGFAIPPETNLPLGEVIDVVEAKARDLDSPRRIEAQLIGSETVAPRRAARRVEHLSRLHAGPHLPPEADSS